MGEHGTRELQIDSLLRDEVLVDLYRVAKQAIRASVDSYSIKALEALYGFTRYAEVSGGDDSIVRFEAWLESGDDALLEGVERYNEEDCRSTVALHEWLLSIRHAGHRRGGMPPAAREPPEVAAERDADRAAVREQLLGGDAPTETDRLLANLLDYHKREQRPQWWEWFRWPQLDDEELIRNRTAIGGLAWDGTEPEIEGRSHAYRMTFPPQEHKLDDRGRDPAHADRLPHPRRRRRRPRDAPPEHRARGRAPPTRPDPGQAGRGLGEAGGAAPLHPGVLARQLRALSLPDRSRGAPAAGRPARRRSRRGRAHAARELPLRPGAAGIRQDVAGSANRGRADAGGPADRRDLAQPQGDPQPARRDPARSRRAGLHLQRSEAGARRGRLGHDLREPLHRPGLRRPTCAQTRRSTSSRARAGRSRAPRSTSRSPSGRSTS